MKLHLPLGLRAALLAVLSVASISHANLWQMEGLSYNDNGGNFYAWNTFYTQAGGNFNKLVTITINNAPWAIDRNVTFSAEANITATGGNAITVNRGFTFNFNQGSINSDGDFIVNGTFNLNGGYIGRNSSNVGSSSSIIVDGGTFNIHAPSETSTWGNAGIGYGEGTTHTIVLSNGGTFTLDGGHIARNKSRAEITVNSGTTFNLRDGYVGSESGSSVKIDIAGTFNMSGGRIGSGLSPSKGTAEVNVESGGSFKISGGRLGYSGSIDLTVKSGGTMVISGGDFSLDDRGTLSFSGNGVNGADYQYGGNSALCVTTALEGYVKHNVTINGPTTFNIYNSGNEITFVGQFTFGGSTLNKVGQGSIIFTDARDSLQGTSGYFSTVAGDSGVVNINRGMVKFDFSASDAFRDFTFNLGYGANVTGTLFVVEGGSYVVRQLGGGITNNDTVTDGRGALTGGGTLIIDYSGGDPAVSAVNVVADETEGAPSLTKRGSGEQRITGAVAAKDISVEKGTLTLGSEGHGVTAESFSIATGTTLNLGGDAATGQLSATGGSISASGALEIGNVASGAQLTDLTLENGSTLAVGGGTLSSESVTFEGAGTLTVNLTGDTHLDFGTFVHGDLTLTLSDTSLMFEDGTVYELFTGSYNSEWGDNITLDTATVGRKSLEFNAENGSLTITGSEEALTWEGGDLTWQDAVDAANTWRTSTAGTDRFYMGDSVTFDSAGGAVTLSGAIVAQQMSVASGTWSFNGGTSLEVMQKLTVAAGASATIAAPTTVGGNVENEGTLTLNGEAEIKGKLLSNGTLTVTGNVHVADAISLQGGTAQFSGSVTGNSITIANTQNATFSGDFNVYTGYYTTVRNSTVVFNGSSTRISALNISDGSRVTFSGTGLTLGNFYQDIDGGSEVHLVLNLSAQENTTSSSGGYTLSPYIRLKDEASRFVVQGYVNGQNITYKYRQNYNSVSGKGTLVMLDTGYQVHNGDTPAQTMDGPRYGDGILSRFLLRSSSATDSNTIRVLELASSENSAHPTVVVFNTYNSYAGYLLKHAKELHVKSGASLGFAYRYDSEYGTTTGPRNMWTTYAPNLVLHLAGTGTASGTEGTGKGAALFLTDSDGSDTSEHTVTVPWKIILDAATTINTVTAGAELLLTNELTNTGNYILTKQGKGKLTLGAGFRTAEGSSGRIDVKAGSLVLGYSDENALKNFSLHVTPGSGVISLQGGSYAVKFLGNDVWTDNTTTNSMVSGSGTLIIDMPSDIATANIGFAAADTGEKVSLVKRGDGSQVLRGAATLNGLTMEGGTLILNGISTAATLTGKGGSLTVSSLTVDEAKGELGTLTVAAGGTLKIGGGTLSGGSLETIGAATLNVSLAGKTHLNFSSVNLGGTLRLELADLFAPDGLDVGSPYQLFDAESWDSEWDANVELVTTQLGRLEVGFENGAIVVTGGERGDLTWASESANTWQAAARGDLFWTNAADGQDFFYNGDNVTFATVGEHSISVVGTVSAGAMNVSEGAWNFAVGSSSSLAVAGKLTLEAGTSVTFSGASAALQGGAEVGSGATLAFTGTKAELNGTLEVQGGTLSLGAAATTISGSIVATSGSVSVTNGSVSSTGSITLGSENSTATMTVSTTGAKSLGDVTVNAGSVFTVNTVTGWQAGGTRVSGAGTLALSGMGYNAVGADAGLLGSFISTTAVGVETAKLGVLSLSANSALGFSGSGEALTNALSRIEEIHVGSRGSLGFVTGGGRAFEGTTGVLHLSGSGTGAGGEKYEEGINAALYVGNGVTATMPWDVVLDADTVLNPINKTSILYFTGALTSTGRAITKNGQGSIILSNTFTTRSVSDSEPDTGTIAVYRGTLTLAYTDDTALSGYTISLAKGNDPYGTLNAEAGGRYVIKGITNAGAYEGGYITGEGTLAVNTAGGSYTSSADVTPGTDASLTLEKLGEGTQAITGDVALAALKVTEGTLALGGTGKTVTVLGAAAVEGTLSMGTSLTLGTLSGAGTVTGSGTLSGDISAFSGSIETDGAWQLTDSADGAVVLQASFAGSGSIELAYADAESITLNGAAKESVSLDHSGSAKLTLTAQNTSTGALTLHDNAAQLGTETAAAAWAGAVAGSGTLTLVNGELVQAVTNSNISLHVDARGAVNAGGTAGAALKSVAIREGGRLTGVSGDIEVSTAATQSMQLTFGTGNIGSAGQALIESGDVHVAESGAFAIDFTTDALVEILKMDGAEVQLQVVSGGALDLGDVESLSDIANGYAELLLTYSRVQTEGGTLVLLGEEEEPPVVDPDDPVDPNPPVVDPDDPVDPNPPVVDPDDPVDPNPPVVDPDDPVDPNPPVVDPDDPVDPNPPVVDPDEPVGPNPPVVDPEPPAKRVYLVLADGSADAAVIRDYAVLDDRIATVLDAGTQLTLELADDAERANTICVNNLVGLSGTALVARGTGSEPLTVELHNSLQEVKDDAALPGGMGAESARGFDTEFEGLIVGEAGVSFVKTGAGTLTVGSKAMARSVERGGVQIEEDLEIQQGAIVIRGGGESSVGSLSFNYNEQPTQVDEQRGLTITGGSALSAGALNELGDRGADNAISLQQGSELILTGSDSLQSTRITGSEGGGTLTLADSAELELTAEAALSGVDVQVDGGELSLSDGADMSGGLLSIRSGGSVAVGNSAAIRSAEGVDIARGGSLTVSAGSEGVHSVGAISVAEGASLGLGENTASSAAGLTGSGAVQGEGGSSLTITGNGSAFSGELVGSGALHVAEQADFTLSGITTAEDSRWNAMVREGGVLTVDVTKSELDTTLGDITLRTDSKLIYRYDNESSARLSAHLVVNGGEKAEFVIESRGRAVEDGEQLDLGGLSYSGAAGDLTVRLKGSTFAYFDGTLYWDPTDGNRLKVGLIQNNKARNKFITGDMEANARAGAELLWAALNPNGAAWKHISENPEGDLAQLVNTIYDRAEEQQNVSRELAAAAGSAVAALGAAASDDMRRQLDGLRTRATMGSHKDKAVWLSAENSHRKQSADGLAPGYTLSGWGGSVGYESAIRERVSAGVSLTAMYNDLKVSAADRADGDMDTTYLSGWVHATRGGWVHSFIASAGLVDASLNRTVNYGEGLSYSTHGNTDGYTLGAMYELGYTRLLSRSGSFALQPVANIQLRHTELSGYTESGSDAALRVDAISQTTVTLGFGVRVQGELSPRVLGRAAWVEARILAKADVGDRCGEATTRLLYGEQSATVKSAEIGATGVELGAGVTLPLSGNGAGFVDVSAELRSGYTGYGATVGYKLSF